MQMESVFKLGELIIKGVSSFKKQKREIVFVESENFEQQKSNVAATLLIMGKPCISKEKYYKYKVDIVFKLIQAPVSSVLVLRQNKNIIGIILDPSEKDFIENYTIESEFNSDKTEYYVSIKITESFNGQKILSFGLDVTSIWDYDTLQICNVLITGSGNLNGDASIVI